MLPNISSMMIEKNCSTVDRFTRIETCRGSDSDKLILEPFFSAAIFSQVMALSSMIVYSTKRFISPLRIEPSIWRATRGETSSMIAWREERIYVRVSHTYKANMTKKKSMFYLIYIQNGHIWLPIQQQLSFHNYKSLQWKKSSTNMTLTSLCVTN